MNILDEETDAIYQWDWPPYQPLPFDGGDRQAIVDYARKARKDKTMNTVTTYMPEAMCIDGYWFDIDVIHEGDETRIEIDHNGQYFLTVFAARPINATEEAEIVTLVNRAIIIQLDEMVKGG